MTTVEQTAQLVGDAVGVDQDFRLAELWTEVAATDEASVVVGRALIDA